MGLRAFNHSNEAIHDKEITSVADAALCRLLSHLLFKEWYTDEFDNMPKARLSSLPEEILRTCQLFEMIYRCSKVKIAASYERVGPDMLRLLCHIIMHEVSRYRASSLPNPEFRDVNTSSYESDNPPDLKPSAAIKSSSMKDASETAPHDTCLQSATRILFLYARVQSLTEAMAQNTRLLSLCISLIQYPIGAVPFEAQHNALFILANMACCRSCVVILSSQDRLLDTVIQASDQNRATTVSHKTSWSDYYQPLRFNCTAFRCLLNLSLPKENKVTMVGKDDLLRSIAYTIGMQTSQWVGIPQGLLDMATQTRRFAMSTLRNIASAPPAQKFRICTFKNGILLDSLRNAAQNDLDPVVKEKSFAVLYNLVCNDTAETLVSHPQLLELLANSATPPSPRTTPQGAGSNKMELSEMPYQSLVGLSHAAVRLSHESRSRLERVLVSVNLSTSVMDEDVH